MQGLIALWNALGRHGTDSANSKPHARIRVPLPVPVGTPRGTPSIYLGERIPYPLFFMGTLEPAYLFLPRVGQGKAGKRLKRAIRGLAGHSHDMKRAENRLSTGCPQNAGTNPARLSNNPMLHSGFRFHVRMRCRVTRMLHKNHTPRSAVHPAMLRQLRLYTRIQASKQYPTELQGQIKRLTVQANRC